jgi:hypothetical protein
MFFFEYSLSAVTVCCTVQCIYSTEPVFVSLLKSPGIDSQPDGPRYDNPICRSGPQCYIGSGIETSESIPGLLKRL